MFGKLLLWDTKTVKQQVGNQLDNSRRLTFSLLFRFHTISSVSQLQFSLEPDPVAVNCTAFNHNGNLLVTGAADGVIRLFGQYNE